MEPLTVAVLAGTISVLVGILMGSVLGYWGNLRLNARAIRATEEALSQQIEQARTRSQEILQESQRNAAEIRVDIEKARAESSRRNRRERRDLQRMQRQIESSRENVKRREQRLVETEENQQQAQKEFKQRSDEQLEIIAGLSRQAALERLLKGIEEENSFEFKRRFRDAERRFQDEADDRAKEILAASMQRLASDVVAETSVTSISIPSDDVKGRLIGREGRNIRAIEATTGVDLIVDDAPNTVAISCFDPVRREVARVALERLIKDGRIQPARIEETVRRAQRDVDSTIRNAGEEATFKAKIRGLHPELVKLMGRLKFRYSYGENVLQHSIEVGQFAGLMASQIGANVQVCKTAGFLHDIGKALTHEVEGPHAEIGADVAKQYGVREPIVLAVREHHDHEMTSVPSFIVGAADAISAARPGARNDSNENYLKRLEELENIARGFDGVRRVFAIQAGREVRVMVDPYKVSDPDASMMGNEIAKSIEAQLQYPGLIKVVVIREYRTESIAS